MKLLFVCVTLALCSGTAFAQLTAFPGAEGYGKHTTGGRGGDVYHVTTVQDNNSQGSLRHAISTAPANGRTIVFDVSGTIDLGSTLKINKPNITIAGQTAPGDGITLKRHTLDIDANNVNIRYIRTRFGDETGNASDAISSRYDNNLILDHVSASWSLDETLSIYHGSNQTIQWSMITESLDAQDHGFGAIWGSNYSTYHHNLIAHHTSRNPRFASGAGNIDYRNNVVYNWSDNSTYGGEKQQVGGPEFNFININMVANYYKPGPATPSGDKSYRIANPSSRDGAADYGKWHVEDNVVVGNATVTADNWAGGVQPQGGSSFLAGLKLADPWPAMAITQQTAEEAYLSVLANAGATLPARDSVDTRIIAEVTNGTASYGVNGIIDSQNEVGGWPVLQSTPAPTDTDQDGMPDAWELKHGLNPNVANNNGDFDNDLYTDVEEYLNDVGAFPSPAPIVFGGGLNGRFARSENWSAQWQPSRFDTAVLPSGTVTVDAVGQHAGSLQVAPESGQTAALSITGGWLEVADAVEIAVDGTDGRVSLSGGKLRAGTLEKGANGSFSFTGGVLSAEQVSFDLENNGGILSPGESIGATSVQGDVMLNAGSLAIELMSPNENDLLSVSGTLALGGDLDVSLLDGFSPKSGSWVIATALDFTGDFNSVTPGFVVAQQGGNLVLRVAVDLPGDFNADGAVDAADYTVWRDNLGAPDSVLPPGTTTDGSGFVDIGDYETWKSHFGEFLDAATTDAARVPEPAGIVLIAFLAITVVGQRTRD